MRENSSNRAAQAATAAVFAVIGVAALAVFVRVAEPEERTPRPPFREDYDEQPLAELLARHGFEDRLRQIAGAGSGPAERQVGRLSGSPGFYRTEALILDAFRAAGLETLTQELEVVVPVTEHCEILDASGVPLGDVDLYPFEPCGLLPTALPAGGITGRLVETESSALKYLAGHDPEQSIVLTYLDAGAGWRELAAVGVKALIVREDEAARAIRANPDTPAPWRGLTSPFPVDYPRFLARGPIEKYAGREITIVCKAAWQTKRVRNLLGVLHGRDGAQEALVVNCFYDSASAVPDLAPGAEQSISLAAMLEFVRALGLYRGQLERDVVFIATAGHAQALAGACRLMEALEPMTRAHTGPPTFEERKADEERSLQYALHGLRFLETMEQAAGTNAAFRPVWLAEEAPFREWFAERIKTVAGEVCLERKEETLQAGLMHVRAGSPVFRDGFDALNATDDERKDEANSHPLLLAYLDARRMEGRAANLISVPIWGLVEREAFVAWDYAGKARHYLERIAEHHRRRIREWDDLAAVEALFARYKYTLTVNLDLYSGGYRELDDLAVGVGIGNVGTIVEPQVTDLANTILAKIPRENRIPEFNVISWGSLDLAGTREVPSRFGSPYTELESEPWFRLGRLGFTVMNYEYHPHAGTKAFTPEDTLEDLPTGVLRKQIPPLGKALLAVAFGRVPFKAVETQRTAALAGTVYANAGVSEMVAGHRMGENTFVKIEMRAHTGWLNLAANRGVVIFPLLATDPYGQYSKGITFDFSYYGTIAADAARFDADGRITYIKDSSPASQAIFKNEAVPCQKILLAGRDGAAPINIAMFRCAPVALYQRTNPTTLKAFRGVAYMARVGLAAPQRVYLGDSTVFLDPAAEFYVAFRDGAPGNEEIQQYRAFMLNVDPDEPIGEEEPELYGKGYLAADTAVLAYPHIDAAESMLRTARKRLALQQDYSMADEQMLEFNARGREWLDVAKRMQAERDPAGAVSAASTSLAYAMNNHPVVRSRISHAVIGILWYLGLLVPFVFFCEKLLFGFPDIRKQLLADGVIFLTVFSLLRAFHPAFQMVRSSLMILLGFIILLLTGLVTLMVGGKFKQNVKDLRSKEGQVEGADINRGGVVGTAFMLGLNNMRRRKVRTGLTCVTLILITFVMICFTSVSSDLVNVEFATGRSSWNGIMIRDANFVPLSDQEVSSIGALYGERFPIATHRWLTGLLSPGFPAENPSVNIDREFEMGGVKTVRRGQVSSVLNMSWNEPMFSGIDSYLLTNKGWFPRPPQTRAEKIEAARRRMRYKSYAILPDTVARDLAISVEDVNRGEPTVSIRGKEYEVLGIFDSIDLSRCLGLDGQSILPYDVNTIQAVGAAADFRALIPEDAGRLPSSEVLIVNDSVPGKAGESEITVSCSILFPKQPYRLEPDGPQFPPPDYREQRRVVLDYLERTGKPAYYATDGISYYGSRRRAKTVAGLLELLVPIAIAALTVFNTMRGSVYERRDEIYVYNAVGIAPNHVFFMFMAEACVYAVMGAMLGYVLSQATGRVLTAMNLTGGMNMDYSSIETILASLAIVAAVLLSTIMPARSAAKLASPSGIVSWALPRARGDEMDFTLPFTFTPHDRVAVISYFWRWLDSNGAGSAGPFFCAPPEAELRTDGDVVPVVSSSIWLKPYDLGVSQRMEISLPTDPDTGEYISTIRLVRLSGNVAAWQRTVKPFLGRLRKQFLNWRATTDADREEMFAEAREILGRKA